MLHTEKKKKEIPRAFKMQEKEKLFSLRKACMVNAIDLIKESEILYKKRRYARAFALAFTSFEEVSKHQIVSDYITEVASKEEFQSAFKYHNIKVAYSNIKIRVGAYIELNNKAKTSDATLLYDLGAGAKTLSLRNKSLYVEYTDNLKIIEPRISFKAKDAKEMIETVKKRIGYILFAEKFNGRIGTRALIK